MSKKKPSDKQLLFLRRLHAGQDFNKALEAQWRGRGSPLDGEIRNFRDIADKTIAEGWIVFDEAADKFVLTPAAVAFVESSVTGGEGT